MEDDQPQKDAQDASHKPGGGQEENASRQSGDHQIVRLIKSIVINPERGKIVDESVVKFKYYNSFNYSVLAQRNDAETLTLGITSPLPRDGKTLVACNLAVSFAMGTQKKTVLVDLNVASPRLHEIFGVAQSPGLAEALHNGAIHVSETAIENLAVLSAGRFLYGDGAAKTPLRPHAGDASPSIGLEQLTAFRDVLYSLAQKFEMIIVDMPSLSMEGMPVLFANYFNGLLVVINSGRTKQEDLDRMFHSINQHQVLGFVFNRFRDQSAD